MDKTKQTNKRKNKQQKPQTDDLTVWYSCSKSEGKAQVANTTSGVTKLWTFKAQRVIKVIQQHFTLVALSWLGMSSSELYLSHHTGSGGRSRGV